MEIRIELQPRIDDPTGPSESRKYKKLSCDYSVRYLTNSVRYSTNSGLPEKLGLVELSFP